ncbi:hypothetical protein BDZ45DRAFT_262105 [Acephala macrosclerotiorum]|nr:hypothetical protein BDZ45DRAFT_262105 [Acephala macrosclerotiorum]
MSSPTRETDMTSTGTNLAHNLLGYRHYNPIQNFQVLFQTWKKKEDLVAKMIEFDLIPLTLDSRYAPTFLHLGSNLLISLIMLKTDPADQLPYRKALLEAFAECCRRNIDSSFGLFYLEWHKMYESTSWDRSRLVSRL